MKLTPWLLSVLAPLTAVSVLAQVSNSMPPAISPPPPAAAAAPAPPTGLTVEPAAKPAHTPKAKHPKAKAKQAKASPARTNLVVVLDPPVTATVKCDVLDVRGQGSFAGEVITHVKKGDTVTVLEEITRGHVRPGEPGQWSRIVMPTNASVWVDADFIDAASKAVRVKKVNLRGGPGENYSVVGRLEKGAIVKDLHKKDNWLEIETPTNAFGFVASEYLDKQAAATPAPELAAVPPPTTPSPAEPVPPPAPAAPVVVNVPAETPPAPAMPAVTAPAPPPAPVAPAPTAASETEQELAALHRATATEPLVTPPAPAPAAVAAQPELAKDETPRTVTIEGYVHRARNIQAPAGYELHDIKTGVLTEYLQPASGNKKFKVFVGTRVRLTGTEFLDPSWPRTPILHIETVDLMP
jgi:uncharacterized protein YgiM (DUF1202 family)